MEGLDFQVKKLHIEPQDFLINKFLITLTTCKSRAGRVRCRERVSSVELRPTTHMFLEDAPTERLGRGRG